MLKRLMKLPYRGMRKVACKLPSFSFDVETRDTQTPATIEQWIAQKVFASQEGPYWPVHQSSTVVGWKNILAGVETSPGLMPGCYIQGVGKIYIGDYTQIAANVGIISANHDVYDSRKHIVDEVWIGAYCWIGMGAVILPGVKLGDFTIVGANSVVTKSFPDGHAVIAGVPAKKIRSLDENKCVRHVSPNEYHGFIRKEHFEEFRKQNLNI